VTGSSGFIGQHLCAELTKSSINVIGLDRQPPRTPVPSQSLKADISSFQEIQSVTRGLPTDRIIHLAAEAEVIMPWNEISTLLSSNLQGTWNVVTALRPSICVFPSSSSVYGNAARSASLARLDTARPLGLYGVSKSAGEILLRDWAHQHGSVAVVLRLANVIGAGCRGLIAYVVRHAMQYPDGSVPAQLRGRGRLVRDYVPVSFVVQVMRAALQRPWRPGSTYVFNVSTGRGLTNRQVTEITQRILRREGFRLRCEWDNPVPHGEAHSVVENTRGLKEGFGVKIPTLDEVEECIQESVLDHLRNGHA